MRKQTKVEKARFDALLRRLLGHGAVSAAQVKAKPKKKPAKLIDTKPQR